MNKYQRIVLIVGALAFFVFLLTTPKVNIHEGIIIAAMENDDTYADIYDTKTALVRGAAVLGSTALLFYALKGLKSKF